MCNNVGSVNESTVEYRHPSVSVGKDSVPLYGQAKLKQAKVSVSVWVFVSVLFFINLKQARVIGEEGTSTEKMTS